MPGSSTVQQTRTHAGSWCCSGPRAPAPEPHLRIRQHPASEVLDDFSDQEFFTPPSSPRAPHTTELEPGLLELQQTAAAAGTGGIVWSSAPLAEAEEASADSVERRCRIPCAFAKVAAGKSADYHSRTEELIGAYIVRTPDNTDEHTTACDYVMQTPRPMRAFAPREVRWREEQVLDLHSQTLVERVFIMKEDLDLKSSFGAWFAGVTCVDVYRGAPCGMWTEFSSTLTIRRPRFIPPFAFEYCIRERNRICDGNLYQCLEKIATGQC